MQKLLACCGLILGVALVAGCATSTPGLGEEAGNATLPPGLTLMDSDEGECEGTVQVAEGTLEGNGDGLEGEFFVAPGENATFELEDEEEDEDIEWACVGEDGEEAEVDSMSCPSGASHVRVTRASSGGELLVECYG